MGDPTPDPDQIRRNKLVGDFVRSRGIPGSTHTTGVEPSELIDQMDGLGASPSGSVHTSSDVADDDGDFRLKETRRS